MARKVLFISPQPFFQWRGSPIRVAFDLQALAEAGYDVDFLTLPLGQDKPIPGVRMIRVWNVLGVKQVPIGPSVSKALFDVVLLLAGLGLALRHRYDVIHGIEDAGALGVIIAGATRAKLVYEKHSDPASFKKGGGFRDRLMAAYAAVERFTARHADAVIGTGPGLADQVRRTSPCPVVRAISDIPSSHCESDPGRVSVWREELKQDPTDVLVAYVGSFAIYQGVDMMFEAMVQAASQTPRARFIIIGGTPAEIDTRRAWLAERQVVERVTFLGRCDPDELPSTLAACDILLSPRRAGVNTPLKILDYFKAGGAIVATDIEANRLLVDETSAMLTATDATAFAGGIVQLVEAPDLRRALAARGRQLYEERYNFPVFRQQLADCYAALWKDSACE